MTDRNGARHVLVAVAGAGGGPGLKFSDCLDASPAIGWLKDLDGRYLQINRRYTEIFGIADDQIRGHTDAELQSRYAVDGPRLQSRRGAPNEPLQLEYTVEPFEDRPALVALRFPVRGKSGEPVAVCGVAAPVLHASVAREESDRLLRIERWTHLSSEEVHAEVLQQWGLMAVADGAEAEVTADEQPVVDRPAAAAVERQLGEERRRVASLREANATAALQMERAQAEKAKVSAGAATSAADQASAGLARQRAETQLLSDALKREREITSALREQLAIATHEVEEARRVAEETAVLPPVPPAAEGAPSTDSESAIHWRPASQRMLTATLASASEWRTGLKDSIKVLGSDGGWDAVAAWAPDERGRFLRCTAMWTSGHDLQAFETSTWQKPLPHFATKLGGLFTSPLSTWLTGLDDADDARFRDAAREGIRSALLVPIRDQATTIGALELLSRSSVTPDSGLTASVEAVALQLGHFSHLLRESAEPRWRVGRL